MLLQKNRVILAAFYFLFISFLFLLPGSAFPKEDWLDRIWFDKWVHVGLFMGLAVAGSWAMELTRPGYVRIFFLLLVLYGILVELVQHYYVAYRSFDVGDWIADIAGSVLGLWLWHRRYIKNRPL